MFTFALEQVCPENLMSGYVVLSLFSECRTGDDSRGKRNGKVLGNNPKRSVLGTSYYRERIWCLCEQLPNRWKAPPEEVVLSEETQSMITKIIAVGIIFLLQR